jgi:hypothetical protein
LEATEIDAGVRNDGGICRNYLGLELQGVDLIVRAEDTEDARKILESDAAA